MGFGKRIEAIIERAGKNRTFEGKITDVCVQKRNCVKSTHIWIEGKETVTDEPDEGYRYGNFYLALYCHHTVIKLLKKKNEDIPESFHDADEYRRLYYQALRAKKMNKDVTIHTSANNICDIIIN